MDEKSSRIRWDDQELARLAAVMAPRLLADPALQPLDAARAAQDVALEPHRRRELKAWSMLEARLQPRLEAALARLRAQPSLPEVDAPAGDGAAAAAAPRHEAATVACEMAFAVAGTPAIEADAPTPDLFGAPADAGGKPSLNAAPAPAPAFLGRIELLDEEDDEAPQARTRAPVEDAQSSFLPVRHEPRPAAARAAAAGLDPLRLEAALVAALQSPAVEAVLVELFTRTLAQAVARVGIAPVQAAEEAPARAVVNGAGGGGQRVLLAGFPEAQQRALSEALGGRFEVRAWRPAQGPQLFETLARLCGVVVVPEDADDSVDADLKHLDVRVVRHAGQASRLAERIGALG
ncbi:hypothetical protein [Azohydromonas aeria]|uniref:hypothetical protein n=1 Tax=Azohydromonas aeria TaxID=2590212 RepID=UPI0012F71487|nr:hypothetical protein [Azohydromonas aeria]